MNLSAMRFKSFTWPHNPKIYQIDFKKIVASHKVPFGCYVLQNLGRSNRVLRGNGEFAGPSAYDDFRKLANVFYDDSPGVLVHPVWQCANALFVALSLRQEPRVDYVSYAFEFWESFDGYDPLPKLITPPTPSFVPESPPSPPPQSSYFVVYGDTLWAIAIRFGLSLNQLIALNPQIRNPNLIYPGDQIRIM